MPGVRRLEIREREVPTFEGMEFGDVGAYERLSGRVICDVDPDHPLNRGIVNLAKAPRNAAGLVEYETDFRILKPRDLDRGNGWVFYEFLNRGTQRAIVRANNAPVAALPSRKEHVGNAFLMRQGYTIVWTAWQGNVEPGGGRMLADFPVPTENGAPVTGLAREEIILDAPDSIRGAAVQEVSPTTFIVTLGYASASLDRSSAGLTARQQERDDRRERHGVSWRFLDPRRIEIVSLPESGLDRGAIYEFVYTARDPVVMGLGYASIRDILSFLRHETHDEAGNPSPLAPEGRAPLRKVMGFGLSQSGRVLRDFTYQGFNQDLRGHAVFDAVVALIGGSRRAWVNAPFAQPGRYSRQHEDHSYAGDQFPFTYVSLTDPVSGRRDGILDKARQAGVCPKIMHLDTDSEVWSGRASLIVTDCAGNDVTLPEEVRAYLTTSIAHGDYALPAGPPTRQATNPLTYGPILRALLVAMVEWADKQVPPPPSRFPSRAAGTLIPLARFRDAFPRIPGVDIPRVLNELRLVDHTTEPPTAGAAYPAYVPAVDSDGNGVGGIRHPLVSAPLGTSTGWNIRAPGYAHDSLYSVYGSFIPFCSTAAERAARADPRPSLEERYGTRDGWVAEVRKAASALVAARLLLDEDADTLVRAAERSWQVFGAI